MICAFQNSCLLSNLHMLVTQWIYYLYGVDMVPPSAANVLKTHAQIVNAEIDDLTEQPS